MKLSKKHIMIVSPIIVLILAAIYLTVSRHEILIYTLDKKFHRGQSILLLGDTLIGTQDPQEFTKRSKALKLEEPDYSFAILSLSELKHIEFIPDEDDEGDTPADVPSSYLGTYEINASGHIGYLKLWAKDGRTYGSIQFPNWANGVREYLRRVKINGNTISFTRSAKTQDEIRRIGISTYFSQKYYGTYKSNGRIIVGQYMTNGAEKLWEGKKIK